MVEHRAVEAVFILYIFILMMVQHRASQFSAFNTDILNRYACDAHSIATLLKSQLSFSTKRNTHIYTHTHKMHAYRWCKKQHLFILSNLRFSFQLFSLLALLLVVPFSHSHSHSYSSISFWHYCWVQRCHKYDEFIRTKAQKSKGKLTEGTKKSQPHRHI